MNELRGSLTNTHYMEGQLGFKGETGMSAYELAVKNGYEGTEQDWVNHFGLDLTGYLKTTDVVDGLTSTATTYPLSAKQGKVLNDSKINTSDIADNLTTNSSTKVLSAKQGKVLNDTLTDANTYSTTKTKIGVWKDGKDIYRQVIESSGTMTTGEWTTITTVSNVDTLIKGYMGGSSNNCVWNEVSLRITSDNLQYYATLGHTYDWVVIEYTESS